MRTIQTNSVNDFAQDANGNLLIITGVQAIAQEAQHYAQTMRGEMIYQTQDGIPFAPLAFGAQPNPEQYAAALRARVMQVPGVLEITELEVFQEGSALRYNATIRTANGIASING